MKYPKVPEKIKKGRKLSEKDIKYLKSKFKAHKNTKYGVHKSKQQWFRFMGEKFDVHPRTIMYHCEKSINEMQKVAGRKKRLPTEEQNKLRRERVNRYPEQKKYYGDVNNVTGPRRFG